MRRMHPEDDANLSADGDLPRNGDISEPESEADELTPPPRRGRQILLILLLLLVTIAASGVAGYLVGTNQGQSTKAQNVKLVTDEQFALALEDLEAGRYDIARQRLEYISRLDPTYPQVAEHLAIALLALNAPTATPIPIVTPTPNLAPIEDLMELAEIKIAEEDWTGAIAALLTLRAKDPSYKPLDVDGLLFTSLRNRGILRITLGLMEEGLYDLSLASRFGPLDQNALHSKSLAEGYLLANSYYGLNWAIAAELFAQLCAQGATSDSCIKYGFSTWSYGDLLYTLEDPCGAREQYQQSLNTWDNPEHYPTATKAAHACETATAPPPVPPTQVSETPEGTPSEEPSATPTPTSESSGDDG